jgi:hypothetical protein
MSRGVHRRSVHSRVKDHEHGSENRQMNHYLLIGACVYFALQGSGRAEEFWATPEIAGKGDDYLVVVGLDAAKGAPRRIRCTKGLPTYLSEMARSADRIDQKLLIRVHADVRKEKSGERAEKVKIIVVCVLPAESYPLLAEIKSWHAYPTPLPEEPLRDPFRRNDDDRIRDPFGE